MGDFLIHIYKGLSEEPFFIVRGIAKLMRTLGTFLISVLIYKSIYGDFELITDIQGVFDFFANGDFVIPIVTYVTVIILFDVILNIILQILADIIFMRKRFNDLGRLEKELSTSTENDREAVMRFLGRVHRKVLQSLMIKDPPQIKELSKLVNEINIKRFDITCLIFAQWSILAVFFKIHLVWIAAFVVVLLIIECLKRRIEFTAKLYKILVGQTESIEQKE